MNAPLRPRIPVVDVQIGSADAGGLHAHQHFAGSGSGNRNLAQFDAGRGLGLHNGLHGGGHIGEPSLKPETIKSINHHRVVERCREWKHGEEEGCGAAENRFFDGIFVGGRFRSGSCSGAAQTADQAWLRYAGGQAHSAIPASVRALGSGALEQSAVHELQRGIGGLTGEKADRARKGETVVGTLDEVRVAFPGLAVPAHVAAHGFWLKRTVWHGHPLVIVAGSNEHGALFGAFDLLRRIATDADLSRLDAIEAPAMPIRWVDEWDNANGTVERGYGGRSIFFEGGKVRDDLSDASAPTRGCLHRSASTAATSIT